MRYFIMEEDGEYINRPQIINWMKAIEPKDLHYRNYSKIPKRIILEARPNKDTDYVDVITVPFLLVSKKVYKMLGKFEPNLQFKEIILLDKKYGSSLEYFMPLVSYVDCLSRKTEFNLDHSVIRRAVVNREKIGDKCIFSFTEGPENLYVVRLDVAESILRRDAYGFLLKETEYDMEE